MTRQTVDVGIHLGVTDAAVAVAGWGTTVVVRNDENDERTPCAVMVAKSGAVTVGRNAVQRAEDDPDNARIDVGHGLRLDDAGVRFARSGRTLSRTALCTEVLSSLKNDVQTRLGEELGVAVLAVPVDIRANHADAVHRAAEAAGIRVARVLDEPTAAAFAYSHLTDVDDACWLVHHMDSHTSDVAVLELRDGDCRLLAHRRDVTIGTRKLSEDVVDHLLIPAVDRELGWIVETGPCADRRWRSALAKLHGAADRAVIDLSTRDTVGVELYDLRHPDGRMGDLALTVTGSQFDDITGPRRRRSLQLCRDALDEAGRAPGRVLLVGAASGRGTPRWLSDMAEALGIPVERSVDPGTVVAHGAAVYAGSLPRPAAPAAVPVPGSAVCTLDVEPAGDDPRPLVGVTFTDPLTDWTGHTIQFDAPHGTPPWQSPRIPVRPDGRVTAELLARPGVNVYDLVLHDPRGIRRPVTPAWLTYRLDAPTSNEDAVLPRSVGIGLASGQVLWVARAGDPVGHGHDSSYVVRVPGANDPGATGPLLTLWVAPGEQSGTDRNQQVVRTAIVGPPGEAALPAGATVEITVEIDRNLRVCATATVPVLDQSWVVEVDL